jgi:hypothetical protein
MPPLVEELGPYRTIAGDRVTVTPSLGPSSSAQTPASPAPEPCRVLVTASLTNLPSLGDPGEHRRCPPGLPCPVLAPTRLRRSRTPVTAPSRHAWCMAFPWSAPPNLAAGQPPLAGHVCRAGPSGCSCRAPPACEHRRRPGQGADIGDRVAVATSRSASYRGPQPALAVLEAARGRGQHGRRRQRGDGAHPAFNQESCRDGQQAVRFGGGNSGASPNIFLLSSSVRRRRRRWSQPWGPGCCWSCLLLVCWSRHRDAGRGRSVTARQIFSSPNVQRHPGHQRPHVGREHRDQIHRAHRECGHPGPPRGGRSTCWRMLARDNTGSGSRPVRWIRAPAG